MCLVNVSIWEWLMVETPNWLGTHLIKTLDKFDPAGPWHILKVTGDHFVCGCHISQRWVLKCISSAGAYCQLYCFFFFFNIHIFIISVFVKIVLFLGWIFFFLFITSLTLWALGLFYCLMPSVILTCLAHCLERYDVLYLLSA